MTRVSPPEPATIAIYAALRPIFATVFRREMPLSAGLTAQDVADWDSFKQIEILIAVEERFAFKFASVEIDEMASLGDLVAVIARRGSDRARPTG